MNNLDSDISSLYGVTTKRLNEQVKRNRSRFPTDFMFQLTAEEKEEVVANCDHLKKVKYSAHLRSTKDSPKKLMTWKKDMTPNSKWSLKRFAN